MAERVEIISIKLDTANSMKELERLTVELAKTKAAGSELEKQYKAGLISEEAYGKGTVELKQKVNNLTQEQKTHTRAIEQEIKVQQSAKDSIVQMQAQVAVLKDRYYSLSEEERKNTKEGKEMAKQITELNEKIRTGKEEVGDFTSSIGNYTGGILKAVDGTGLLVKVTSTAKEAHEGLNTTLTILKAGLGGNISLLKLFRLALAATGVGALVLLLGGLVSWLTRTQEGIDYVSQKTKGFTTVVGVLIDKLSAIGKATIDWFDDIQNLGDFLTKLSDEIIVNLTNRLKGFMIILEGFKSGDTSKIRDGILQVTTGITDATAKAKEFANELNNSRKAAEAIEKENQRLREAERALNLERKQSRALIKELNMLAEDTNKSTTERANAARKAMDIELNLDAKRRELQQQKIDNIKAEQALTNNLTADNDALAEAQGQLAEMAAESLELRTTLQNKLNSILKEGAAAQAKEFAEAQKRRQAMAKELGEANSLDMLAREVDLTEKLNAQNRKRVEDTLKAINDEAAAQEWLAENNARLEKEKEEMIDKSIALSYAVTDAVLENVDKQSTAYKLALKAKQAVAIIEAGIALPGLLEANAVAGGKISAIAPPATVPLGAAYTIAADALAVAKIGLLIKQLKNIKTDSFYQGGFTEKGNPYEEATNLGPKPYTYHKSEYITPAKVLATSEGAFHVAQLEKLRTGKSFYQGGTYKYDVPAPTRTALAGGVNVAIDYNKMAAANAKIQVVAKYSDLKTVEAKVKHIQNRASA